MKLLTKKLIEQLPKLYSQEASKGPTVFVKFFTPDLNWTWYVTEYDPENKCFYGIVKGPATKIRAISGNYRSVWGYFSLNQLENVVLNGVKVERDLYFEKQKLSELAKEDTELQELIRE